MGLGPWGGGRYDGLQSREVVPGGLGSCLGLALHVVESITLEEQSDD